MRMIGALPVSIVLFAAVAQGGFEAAPVSAFVVAEDSTSQSQGSLTFSDGCSEPITFGYCKIARAQRRGRIDGTLKVRCKNVYGEDASAAFDLSQGALSATVETATASCGQTWASNDCRMERSKIICAIDPETPSASEIRLRPSHRRVGRYTVRGKLAGADLQCLSSSGSWVLGFEAGSTCGQTTCVRLNARTNSTLECGTPRDPGPGPGPGPTPGTDPGPTPGPDCTEPSGDPCPPIPSLKVVEVTDLDADGNYDQDDINIALRACSPGCNLKLLPVTYKGVRFSIEGTVPQGFAMYGAGIGRTILQARITPTNGKYEHAIYVTSLAPNGVIFQDFTLDGMKVNQPRPTQMIDKSVNPNYHLGIVVADFFSRGTRNTSGIVRRLQIKDFLGLGIWLLDSAQWRIEQNQIMNIGCHTIDTPCGTAWNTQSNWAGDNQPNRKTNGFGIQIGKGNLGTVVANNTISGATKIGIEIFVGGDRTCSDPLTSRDIVIENNHITRAGGGIVVNSGCNYIVRDNVVENSIATGSENESIGQGYGCVAGGENGLWLRNRASNNQLNGFNLDCPGTNIDVIENISSNNCLTTRLNAADITLSAGRKHTGVVGSEVQNNTVSNNHCYAGMAIWNRKNVTLSGGSVEGGKTYGLWLEQDSGMSISNLQVNSPNPSYSDIGIYIHSSTGIVVAPSVNITNFSRQSLTQ